ncbi:MAG: M56 family metallopeptidase [Bacteroidota bacterium]
MISSIDYFLEFNIVLVLLGIIYMILFREEPNFRFRRFFILSSISLSILLPFISFKANSPFPIISQSISKSASELSFIVLQEIIITSEEVEFWNFPRVILGVYVLIVLFIIIRFLLGIINIIRIKRNSNSKITRFRPFWIIENDSINGTFTFFNYLFTNNRKHLTPQVISHEKAHVNERHSVDIILVNMLTALFWANPMSWYFRKHLQDLHEFLADRKALRDGGETEYINTLLSQTVPGLQLSVGHYLNKSLTLKRLKMMKAKNEKIKKWKLAVAFTFMACSGILIGCNEDVIKDVDDVLLTATQLQVPEKYKNDLKQYQEANPDADFVYIQIDSKNEEAFNRIKSLDPKSIAIMEVDKSKETISLLFNRNGALRSSQDKGPDENGIYTIVEEAASPSIGLPNFYQYIRENLKYPEQAKKLGVEGKVLVQFVVNEKGELTNVKAVKGIGAGCDAEAVRVINEAMAWKPGRENGKAVKQRIILPISFALKGDSNNKG